MASNINPGKKLEEQFALSSEEQGFFTYRIKDFPQKDKFGNPIYRGKNIADYFIMSDSEGGGYLFALELKTTSKNYMSIQKNPEIEDNCMIKYHQMQSLVKISQKPNVVAGFILNFREDDDEITFWMRIDDFSNWFSKSDKKSINKLDIVLNGGEKIPSEKKRKYHRYDVRAFIEKEVKRQRKDRENER